MGRTMPTECWHGRIIDWGDFGPGDDDEPDEPEGCEQCEAAPKDRILWENGREVVDEIVAHNVTIHVERMAGNAWWMGVDSADGKHCLHVNFGFYKRQMYCHVEDEGLQPWPFAEDEEHEQVVD